MSDEKVSKNKVVQHSRGRRKWLSGLLAAGAAVPFIGSVRAAEDDGADSLRFPGDPPEHKVVYQFNKAELGYHDHVIFSVGEMVRKYGDNVKVVVVAFAEGIHILGKNPGREVKEEILMELMAHGYD